MVLNKLEKIDLNIKEIIDTVLTEEEGGELFRFNRIVFRIKGRTEGKNPHLHFLRPNCREGAIRLDVAEYYPHGNPLHYTETLSKKELSQFIAFISSSYERACELWNYIPDGNKIDPKGKIPNYLNIIYPK